MHDMLENRWDSVVVCTLQDKTMNEILSDIV